MGGDSNTPLRGGRVLTWLFWAECPPVERFRSSIEEGRRKRNFCPLLKKGTGPDIGGRDLKQDASVKASL